MFLPFSPEYGPETVSQALVTSWISFSSLNLEPIKIVYDQSKAKQGL